MRRIMLGGAVALALAISPAAAETYFLITHSDGTDPFWPVAEKGARDAAAKVGATIEVRHPNQVDAVEMAQIIETAITQAPDGLILSIPDPDVIGPMIESAIAAGIPVVSINSGGDVARQFGVLLHVGQPEYDAGKGAGTESKALGVTKHLCVNPQASNEAIAQRCQGYADGLGQPMNMIDASNDPVEIKTRTSASLTSDPSIDGVLATGPHVCTAVLGAIAEVGREGQITVSCFDLSPEIIAAIEDGRVAFAIDQQQYLQGYMPVIVLDLYVKYGLLPGGDVLSGPGFVTKDNAAMVKEFAGVYR